MNSSQENESESSEASPGDPGVLSTPFQFDPIPGLHLSESVIPAASVPSMASWGITKEQLDLFQLISESCTDASEARRVTGLQIICNDARVDGVLPMLAPFIADTVSFNVAEENLEFLLYMMRMISALLTNSALSLDKYIHLILPAVLACLLSDQICANPGAEDHWAVRKFANSVATEIVWRYSCTLPTVLESYKEALLEEALTTVYGGIVGLSKMGHYAVRIWLLPQLKQIAERIEPHLTPDMEFSSVSLNTLTAKYIRYELAEVCGPVLLKIHAQQDLLDVYTSAYGFLGTTLYAAVILLRIRMLATQAGAL